MFKEYISTYAICRKPIHPILCSLLYTLLTILIFWINLANGWDGFIFLFIKN